MKFTEGYIDDYDVLEQMPVSVLEDIMIRLRLNWYINDGLRQELMEKYPEERKEKIIWEILSSETDGNLTFRN